jgi:predicted transcriptional regulator
MTSWFARPMDASRDTGRLGPLEWRVLEALWSRTTVASVRDLQPEFAEIAYTTLMTTLDRLYRKGVLRREKSGRAFLYQPRLSRAEFESARATAAVRMALAADDESAGLLLSFLVQAVSDRDHELLEELEALVRARRAEIEGKRG